MDEPLAEKVVQPAINPAHLAYCPTMDLVALANVEQHVQVYRFNGQLVFGVQNRDPFAKIGSIKWKPNGWGINFTEGSKVSDQMNRLKGEMTLDDVISRNPQSKILDTVPDLPLDLAFLDIETSLPKLSPLSSGGIEDDIFSSRTSLDTLFQPLTVASTDTADILIVGFEDGTVHLSIYDFFEIGSFRLQHAAQHLVSCRPLLHGSHPSSTTHSMLVSSLMDGEEVLHMIPLDLRLLSNMGRYLPLLASKSTQLHNVLRYIHQVQRQMYSDFKASQELPNRFMGSIDETLMQQSDCNWRQTAYHLVVTGHCPPEVKEWLVDQVGERGHKRWEKAAVTGYESVRRLAHENLLPALERFIVIVSRLRGLSKFQVSNATLGLSTQEMDNLLDNVNCLQLVSHRILIAAGTELRQCQAFCGWLRQEIDTQAADPSSSETTEKDINVDHASTLEYIQGPMMQSQVLDLFNLQKQGEQHLQWDLAAEGRSLLELYKREYKNNLPEDQTDKRRLPGLDALIQHLDSQCESVFHRIGETQRRNVRFGAPVPLGLGAPLCMDMRTILESVDGEHLVTYVALGARAKQSEVRIYRILVEITNGMSSTKRVEYTTIRTASWDVKDIKFVDDEEVVIAACDQESSRLLRLFYRKVTDRSQGLQYQNVNDDNAGAVQDEADGSRPNRELDLSDAEQCKACTWHEYPAGVSWAPQRLEVNGRKGRRVICVLAQDSLHYRIYDLDRSSCAEGPEDGRLEGDGEDMK